MKKLFTLLLLMATGFVAMLAAGPSGTLPVIYIDIENGAEVTSKETYLKAKYWLDPKGTEGIDAIGTQAEPLTMKIKGRGNYTFFGFDKKPYRLKLDTKQKLLGFASSKHFGLLAHADDSRGFMRNTIGYEVSKGMGLPWTPEQCPIELVINGTYRGLYFLVELIRIDKNRVNISKWEEEDAAGNPLDKWVEGGTLIEIDNYDEDGQVVITDGHGQPMRITYDKSVDPGYEPDGYKEWLTSEFSNLNSLIFGDKNSDEIWNYLDLDDCARFVLVQEIVNNFESFHGSCYMFREKGEGQKWHFSPVWDFGSAFQTDTHPQQHFWENPTHYNHWVDELWEFPKFKAKMKELWQAYHKDHFERLAPFAENFIAEIKEAAACDKERWPEYGNDDLDGKLRYVKNFLADAETYLNQVFEAGNNDEPIDFTVPEDEEGVYHLFFRQTGNALTWEKVKMFYWGGGLSSPVWPGLNCELVRIGDENLWHYRLLTPGDSDEYMIIFDNGASGKGENQTYDLKARKRGVYTLDMADKSEPTEFLKVGAGPGAVEGIETDDATLRVRVSAGEMTITAAGAGIVRIYSIDGTTRNVEVTAGSTTIALPKGIYIVEGKKYAL